MRADPPNVRTVSAWEGRMFEGCRSDGLQRAHVWSRADANHSLSHQGDNRTSIDNEEALGSRCGRSKTGLESSKVKMSICMGISLTQIILLLMYVQNFQSSVGIDAITRVHQRWQSLLSRMLHPKRSCKIETP